MVPRWELRETRKQTPSNPVADSRDVNRRRVHTLLFYDYITTCSTRWHQHHHLYTLIWWN